MSIDPKKLKIPAEAELVLIGAPESFASEMAAYGIVRKRIGKKSAHWVMVFIKSRAELVRQAEIVLSALAPDGVLWIAFPKKSSGIKTDLDRDTAHRALQGLPAQWLSLVAIDKTWSAFALRKTAGARLYEPSAIADARTSNPFIDLLNRKVLLPDYLESALSAHPSERAFFDGLAFTHRKEYVVWITEAKKVETRDARIHKMILMLQTRKKNPSEK